MKIFSTVLAAVLLVAALAFAPVNHASAGTLTNSTTQGALRATGVVTTSSVLGGTTVTLSGNVDYVDFYSVVTIASATSITVIPCYTYYDHAGTGTYWECTAYAQTYTRSGSYTIRVPRAALAASTIGVKVVGVGTMTSTDCVVGYKTEQ
jgi:hypothetical protein